MTKNTDPVVGPGGYLEITVVDVVKDEPTSLSAAFSNGASFEVINLHDHLSGIDILEQVRDDAAVFSTAAIDDWGMLAWDNGADMSADSLYRLGMIQTGQGMGRNEFRAWMKRHDLIVDNAGPVLGVSRATIARYSSGEKLIPRTILLACKGYDAMQADKTEEDAA